MEKWNVVLSTTEPYNYVGLIQVRQGNRNSEVVEATVTQNGTPVDFTGCKAYFEAVVGEKHPIQRNAKIVDAKNGKVQYTFDEYSMQLVGRQTANFIFYKGEDVIATTQNFSYFVVRAVSKTPGEMGSYWQTVEDLIADMTAFINENQGDFTDWMNARKSEFEAWRDAQKSDYITWFESIKDILSQIDPGGKMLLELIEARKDVQGVRHDTISDRLLADMEFLYQQLHDRLFTLPYGEIEIVQVLQDDLFSVNHEVEKIGTAPTKIEEEALVIATIDDPKQGVFTIEKVGEI